METLLIPPYNSRGCHGPCYLRQRMWMMRLSFETLRRCQERSYACRTETATQLWNQVLILYAHWQKSLCERPAVFWVDGIWKERASGGLWADEVVSTSTLYPCRKQGHVRSWARTETHTKECGLKCARHVIQITIEIVHLLCQGPSPRVSVIASVFVWPESSETLHAENHAGTTCFFFAPCSSQSKNVKTNKEGQTKPDKEHRSLKI